MLPGTAKKESKLDEFAISKLPLKKQNLIRKKAEAASHSFNWNSLFMSQDDVNSSTAARLGVSLESRSPWPGMLTPSGLQIGPP